MSQRPIRPLVTLLAVALAGVALWEGWFAPTWPSNRSLARALRGVDRIRVRTGGTCHTDPAWQRTLFEEADPARVAEVIAGLRINAVRSGFHCMCCGDPSLELYRGEKRVATLGLHHGKGVRWPGGWLGDGRLTPESAATLNAWLAEHGVSPDRRP